MAKKQQEQVCELCGREVLHLTRHHLVPREEGGRHDAAKELFLLYHIIVHLIFSNLDRANAYNAIPALQKA